MFARPFPSVRPPRPDNGWLIGTSDGWATWFPRYELLTAGLVAYYSALGLKDLVGRGRPPALLTDVIVRGPAAHGLGFPSGHAAVSFALTATAVPFLARRWRRVIWVLPLTVGLARMFVGAHFPLDVAGGFALGWTVGALVHLVRTCCSRCGVRLPTRIWAMRSRSVRPSARSRWRPCTICWQHGPGCGPPMWWR